MQPLSVAANVAWQIAALETAAAQHPLMECEHLLIGILSLRKGLSDGYPHQRVCAQQLARAINRMYLVSDVHHRLPAKRAQTRIWPGSGRPGTAA